MTPGDKASPTTETPAETVKSPVCCAMKVPNRSNLVLEREFWGSLPRNTVPLLSSSVSALLLFLITRLEYTSLRGLHALHDSPLLSLPAVGLRIECFVTDHTPLVDRWTGPCGVGGGWWQSRRRTD